VFGLDAYGDLYSEAAALLELSTRNHALMDGNKRTAWAAAWTFLYLNGIELSESFNVDDAEEFMTTVATTNDHTVEAIASRLSSYAAS
jgi:death-on-curing protein